jgi:hypothetical protein
MLRPAQSILSDIVKPQWFLTQFSAPVLNPRSEPSDEALPVRAILY